MANMGKRTSRVVVTSERHVAAVHGRRGSSAISDDGDEAVVSIDGILVGGIPDDPDTASGE